MYPTKYHKPASLEDAVAGLRSAEDGALLAGGQTLLPTMKQHLAAPTDLIDIRGIDGMSGIRVEGDVLVIGAATTHAEVAGSSDVQAAIPALAQLASGIGDAAVRHMGTIGGSVANNDPVADYPSAVLALGATIVTDRREIAAEDYFQGMFMTALEEAEIIRELRFPKPRRAAYAKFPNPASRYALVGVFVADTADGACVAVTGASESGVFRHEGLEAALSGDFSADAVDGVEISSEGFMSDIHADADYRANLVRVMARRAVAALG